MLKNTVYVVLNIVLCFLFALLPYELVMYLGAFSYGMLNALSHKMLFGKTAPIRRIPIVALRMVLWGFFIPVYGAIPTEINSLILTLVILALHQATDFQLVKLSLE